ncbi:MAG: pyridoxamine 5'-phosphate oxidase [Candidatus Dadabacteria bacterium]|nr:pyridoxamine 5'-phosphate oxidase [Candidatus Dadabacteria bacterium]
MSQYNSDKQYDYSQLLESEIDPDPFVQFGKWFNEASEAGIKYPNAFALATSTIDAKPNARFLLLKEFNAQGFVFYTNSESVKGIELYENPRAHMVFWWDAVERQVRINGLVEKVSEKEADEYFKSRPRGSQIGAWASNQSTVIDSRTTLESRYKEIDLKYEGADIPRPPYWNGYRLIADSLEFWQGRPDRLHDRLRYKLDNGEWVVERLCP